MPSGAAPPDPIVAGLAGARTVDRSPPVITNGRDVDLTAAPADLSAVGEALRRLRRGEIVLVSDGTDREDETDLTLAAEFVTPEAIAFMLRHGRGLVCVPCDAERLDRLALAPMVADAGCDTAFTVSVDHKAAGSGISAVDRAATIKAMADPWAAADDFVRPGHVFPLRARAGGVLERPGHTEAAVDLMRLAGLETCAVVCEALKDDGSIAAEDDLAALAHDFGLARVSIAQIAAWQAHASAPTNGALSYP